VVGICNLIHILEQDHDIDRRLRVLKLVVKPVFISVSETFRAGASRCLSIVIWLFIYSLLNWCLKYLMVRDMVLECLGLGSFHFARA